MLVVLNTPMDQKYGLTPEERRDFRQLYDDPWFMVQNLLGHASRETTVERYLAPVADLQLRSMLADAADPVPAPMPELDAVFTRIARESVGIPRHRRIRPHNRGRRLVTPRGREAALPPDDHTRPPPLAFNGLLVHHYNNRGQVKDYDFATLPVAQPLQQSLAALFASRCAPETWATHRSSQAYWRLLVRFTRFLAEQSETVSDLDNLSTTIIRRWRNSMPLNDKRPFTEVALPLHDDPRLPDRTSRRRTRAPHQTTEKHHPVIQPRRAASHQGRRPADLPHRANSHRTQR